jgi:uncharacterized protein YhfF
VKTATTSVLAAYHAEQEPLPRTGDRAVVVQLVCEQFTVVWPEPG